MFIGVEIRRRKDDSGKGWYRIAPAIIQQDSDEEREARTYRGLTAGAILAAMLIVSLMAISYTVPDPIITTETTIIGVNK